ncbi:hypothetical protein [Mucilaginibacter sp. JRF]|nr:hypothetical protein [Mucilaginibacter sp. JRF]
MISVNVNQKVYQVDADPDMPLLWAIFLHGASVDVDKAEYQQSL